MLKTPSVALAELNAAHAAAERGRRTLVDKRGEYARVDTVLSELESGGGSSDSVVLAPLFGGAALLPVTVHADSQVVAWLGGDVFARCTPAKARELLRVRSGELDSSIEEITRKMAAMATGSEGIAALAKSEAEMTADGVVNICEPIPDSDSDDEDGMETEPRLSADVPMADSHDRRMIAGSKGDRDRGGVDEFFDAMEREEEEWEMERERQEELGIELPDDADETAARKSAEKHGGIPSRPVQAERRPPPQPHKPEAPMDAAAAVAELMGNPITESAVLSEPQMPPPQQQQQVPRFKPRVPKKTPVARKTTATSAEMPPTHEQLQASAPSVPEIIEHEITPEYGPPSAVAPFVQFGSLQERGVRMECDDEEACLSLAPPPGRVAPKGPPTVARKAKK